MRTHFENLTRLYTSRITGVFNEHRVGVSLQEVKEAFNALFNSEETDFNAEEKELLVRILSYLAPYFDQIETAASSLKDGNDYIDWLIKAHQRGIVTIEQIYEVARQKEIGLYMSRSYYMNDEWDSPYNSSPEFASFTAEELDQKLKKFAAFLSYLKAQDLSLARLQILSSQKETISYYYHDYIHDFAKFLSEASGSVILAYITQQFLSNEVLIQLAPVAEKVVAAIRTKEASDAFTLIQAANNRESPLGRYFVASWGTRTQLANLNRLLTTHCAAHTISLIRANSFPAELLAKVTADKASLVTYLASSTGTELLREALNPEKVLGRFFRHSGGLFDFTTPWCLAELQKILDRRSTVGIVASSGHSLFARAPATPAAATVAAAISCETVSHVTAAGSLNGLGKI